MVLLVTGIATSGGSGGSSNNQAGNAPAAAKKPAAPPAASASAPAVEPTEAAPATTQAAPATTEAAPPPPPPPVEITYPGKKDGDTAVKAGESVKLSGWTATTTPLKQVSVDFLGEHLCTNVTLVNRDDDQQEWNTLSWKMQTPNGAVLDMAFTADDKDLDVAGGGLAPGGKITGRVCFEDKDAGKGDYVVFWQPDIFSSEDRGAWVNKR
nr:DUF4352 domain-containing protein [Motilibacter aurantiacus]